MGLLNKVTQGDCLEIMREIPDGSVDMILCDLPYGTTRNKWDSVIPLDKLWLEYNRIIKDNGAIVLTAQTPFDKVLGASNIKFLKYEWIWEKDKGSGFLNAKKMPLKTHENVLVFYKKPPTYNPQITYNHTPQHSSYKQTISKNYGRYNGVISDSKKMWRYPRTNLKFNGVNNNGKEKVPHPTQKPVALFEYLIKTYTNEGETVLDNCIGSGTTAVACINTNRNFIGIEREPEYVEIAKRRIDDALVNSSWN